MWCILAAGGWCEVRRLRSTPGSTWWPGLLHPVLYKHPTVCVHLERTQLLTDTTPVPEYEFMWCVGRESQLRRLLSMMHCDAALLSLKKPVYFQSTWLTSQVVNRKPTRPGKRTTMATSRLLALRTLVSPRTVLSLNTFRQFSASKVLSSKPFYTVTFQTGSDKFKVQVRIVRGQIWTLTRSWWMDVLTIHNLCTKYFNSGAGHGLH